MYTAQRHRVSFKHLVTAAVAACSEAALDIILYREIYSTVDDAPECRCFAEACFFYSGVIWLLTCHYIIAKDHPPTTNPV